MNESPALVGATRPSALAQCRRAAPVQQFEVHSRNGALKLFEKGYGRDPAAIAQAAIKEATDEGIDVVLASCGF